MAAGSKKRKASPEELVAEEEEEEEELLEFGGSDDGSDGDSDGGDGGDEGLDQGEDSEDYMDDEDGEYDNGVSASDEEVGEEDQDRERERQLERSLSHLTASTSDLAALSSAQTSDAAILHLEVAELLSETQLDCAKQKTSVDGIIQQLKAVLKTLPTKEISEELAKGYLKQLGVELGGTLPVKPPTSVKVVGSYATCTAVRPSPVVDVAVEMPAECFHKKAYLNHRYHARRALYLAAVAQHLASTSSSSSSSKQQQGQQQQQQSMQGLFSQQEVLLLHGDPRKPALLIRTPPLKPGKPGSALTLRLLPTLPPSAFALHKLDPTHNAVRSHRKPSPVSATNTAAATQQAHQHGQRDASNNSQQHDAGEDVGVDPKLLLPTPCYNAGVVEDVLVPLQAAHLQALFAASPRLRDGVALLKVWARHHGLDAASGPEGLDGHFLSVLVAHVAERNKLAAVMTPLQLMRAALQVLADPSISGLAPSKGLGMAHCAAALGLPPPPPLAAWRASGAAAVLVDFTGWSNAAAHLTRGSMAQVSLTARQTLALFERPADADEAFSAAFLTRAPACAAFDYCWRVTLPVAPVAPSSGSGSGFVSTGDKPAWREQEARVESLVRQALLDRAKLVRCIGRSAAGPSSLDPCTAFTHGLPGWPAPPTSTSAAASTGTLNKQGDTNGHGGANGSKKSKKGDNKGNKASDEAMAVAVMAAAAGSHGNGSGEAAAVTTTIWVGAVVDPLLALRYVDIGPSADDTKAATRFRAFWGDKSELRRFQDGKISEAVVWQAGPATRHTIPDMIVKYVAARHLPGSSVACTAGVLDAALTPPPALGLAEGAEVMSLRGIESSLDKLTKQLRALEGLVLKVIAVQTLSAISRGTAVFPPQPHVLAGGPDTREGAARLPRCIAPIEVLVQVENSGRWPDDPVAFRKMKAALGLQIAAALTAATGYVARASEEQGVDVYVDGYAFRLTLYSGRDEAMLTKARSEGRSGAGDDEQGEGGSVVSAEENPLIASWHHGLISAVGGANAAYAPATRLAKRWVSSHMLSHHLAAEAVELLVAAAFTRPSPLPPPASRLSGFLRFLELIARWPWATQPLVVDPLRELGEAQRRQIRARYDKRRATAAALPGALAPPAMFIVTPRDWDSANWTHDRPSTEIVQRLVVLANASAAALSSLLLPSPSAASPAAPSSGKHSKASSLLPLSSAGASPAEPSSKAWLSAVMAPRLADFDAFILLRKEALPLADYALKLPSSGSTSSTSFSSFSSPPEPLGDGDALTELLDAPREPPPKRARVFLRAFPEQVLRSGSGGGLDVAKLQPELLAGFDPVSLLLDALAERFGHLATFCVDAWGGRLVGIKWRAQAFLPAPLRVPSAHTSLVLSSNLVPAAPTSAAGGKAGGSAKKGVADKRGSAAGSAFKGLALPNIIQVFAEIRELGEGLVDDIVPCTSAHLFT